MSPAKSDFDCSCNIVSMRGISGTIQRRRRSSDEVSISAADAYATVQSEYALCPSLTLHLAGNNVPAYYL